MKSITKILLFPIVVVGLLFTNGCGGDEPSASEVMLKKLMAHPWQLSSALVDGTDKTSVYSGLSLTFTKTNITATDITPSWPTTGTWEFTDGKAIAIIRNDDLEIQLVEVSKDVLKISYTWSSTTFEPGRVKSVSGNHVLSFVPVL
jgi:hypothetical protein